MNICIYHEKGGAGKSTLTVALAFELALPITDLDARKVSSKYAAAAGRDPSTFKPGWIVDYPAGMDLSLASYMREADLVIIPTHASTFDIEGIGQTIKFVTANAGQATKIAFFGTALSNESSAKFLKEGLAKWGHPLIGYFKHRVVYERSRLSAKPAAALNKAAKVEVQAAAVAIRKYLGV